MDKKPLSTLIREGAKLRPKARGVFFERGCSCAMGAAMEAAGVGYDENATRVMAAGAPILPELFTSDEKFTALGEEIYRWNDSHDVEMTREEIADALEARGL